MAIVPSPNTRVDRRVFTCLIPAWNLSQTAKRAPAVHSRSMSDDLANMIDFGRTLRFNQLGHPQCLQHPSLLWVPAMDFLCSSSDGHSFQLLDKSKTAVASRCPAKNRAAQGSNEHLQEATRPQTQWPQMKKCLQIQQVVVFVLTAAWCHSRKSKMETVCFGSFTIERQTHVGEL